MGVLQEMQKDTWPRFSSMISPFTNYAWYNNNILDTKNHPANLACGFDEQAVAISRGEHEITSNAATQITDPGGGGDFKELKGKKNIKWVI